ncbi:MAG: glycosyltransferase family 2 protein, partial [Actinobacteria bacterium]|nr:glycosyltransferase family 2 protein [Actinomycetota bacterium]
MDDVGAGDDVVEPKVAVAEGERREVAEPSPRKSIPERCRCKPRQRERRHVVLAALRHRHDDVEAIGEKHPCPELPGVRLVPPQEHNPGPVPVARHVRVTLVKACVVIPTLDACELVLRALRSLEIQEPRPEVIVVDNASSDGTAAAIAEAFPWVHVRRLPHNLGFGRAINAAALDPELEADVLVLVNNDTVCEPGFVAAVCAPFADPAVGMVAGVLLQERDPERIDSAGIELDRTLRSFDLLANTPVSALAGAPDPVGPCGGAAAYRLGAFRDAGGFDDAFFAYWEDVDLALRFRLAGWECRLAPGARAHHLHGATLGAMSPAARRLEAFGRSFILNRYRVAGSGP